MGSKDFSSWLYLLRGRYRGYENMHNMIVTVQYQIRPADRTLHFLQFRRRESAKLDDHEQTSFFNARGVGKRGLVLLPRGRCLVCWARRVWHGVHPAMIVKIGGYCTKGLLENLLVTLYSCNELDAIVRVAKRDWEDA